MAEYSNACLVKNMRRFTMFVSWMSMAIGVLSLIGWLLGIHLLTSVLPGHISIKVNTAIGLILLGASLWLQREERNLRPWVERMTHGAAGLVAFIGFLSLLENLFGKFRETVKQVGLYWLIINQPPVETPLPKKEEEVHA